MELCNLPENVAAAVKTSDVLPAVPERRLLAAVKEAGYWLDNVEYSDIDSGSISGLITYQERCKFAQEWDDTINTVVDEEYLNLEGIESLDDAYSRYCEAAVMWASAQLERTLEDAADISPEMLEELVDCAQNARRLNEDAVWSDHKVTLLPSNKLDELAYARVDKSDVINIWLDDASAETWKVQDSSGAAAGVMLVGDGRAIWFPDASQRHA